MFSLLRLFNVFCSQNILDSDKYYFRILNTFVFHQMAAPNVVRSQVLLVCFYYSFKNYLFIIHIIHSLIHTFSISVIKI